MSVVLTININVYKNNVRDVENESVCNTATMQS